MKVTQGKLAKIILSTKVYYIYIIIKIIRRTYKCHM